MTHSFPTRRSSDLRPRGLRTLRLRVPLFRGRGRLPRGARPPRARPARRRPAAAARRRGRAVRQERRQGKEKGVRVTFPPSLTAAESEQGKVTLTPFSFPATDHAMIAPTPPLAERGAPPPTPPPMTRRRTAPRHAAQGSRQPNGNKEK